jgi:uncharacterized membrane protein YeaQ/YmgE (transglycosylase-associated protein family)
VAAARREPARPNLSTVVDTLSDMTRDSGCVNALQQSVLSLSQHVDSPWLDGVARVSALLLACAPRVDRKTKEIQMDASTAAGTVGAGLGVFLLILLVVGAISGLIIGGIARFLLPGPDPMSWPRTILYGIGGSFVGGMVGRLLHVPESLSFVLSVACAAGLIWVFTRRKKPAA